MAEENSPVIHERLHHASVLKYKDDVIERRVCVFGFNVAFKVKR